MNGSRTYFAGLITGVALAAIAFAAAYGARPAQAQFPPVIPRWEYTFSERRAGDAKLNRLGDEGWEAYGINADFQVAMKRLKHHRVEPPR